MCDRRSRCVSSVTCVTGEAGVSVVLHVCVTGEAGVSVCYMCVCDRRSRS